MRLSMSVLPIVIVSIYYAGAHAQAADRCQSLSAQGTFLDIAVPGADFTYVTGINNRGQVVGTYSTAGTTSGFVYERGSYKTLTIPGSATTRLTDIDSRGMIVGSYDDSSGSHGFIWNDGDVVTLDAPGAIATSANGINDAGVVVGIVLGPGGIDGIEHGFVFRDGQFDIVDYPDATGTTFLDLNNAGTALGVYVNPAPAYFLYTGGEFAPAPLCASNTVVVEITNQGDLVGSAVTSQQTTVGAVATARGLLLVEAPDATLTVLVGANAGGVLIGEYWDVGNNHHSFMFVPR